MFWTDIVSFLYYSLVTPCSLVRNALQGAFIVETEISRMNDTVCTSLLRKIVQ